MLRGVRLNWVRVFTLWGGGLFKQLLPSSLSGGQLGFSLTCGVKAGSLKRLGEGHMSRKSKNRKTRKRESTLPQQSSFFFFFFALKPTWQVVQALDEPCLSGSKHSDVIVRLLMMRDAIRRSKSYQQIRVSRAVIA